MKNIFIYIFLGIFLVSCNSNEITLNVKINPNVKDVLYIETHLKGVKTIIDSLFISSKGEGSVTISNGVTDTNTLYRLFSVKGSSLSFVAKSNDKIFISSLFEDFTKEYTITGNSESIQICTLHNTLSKRLSKIDSLSKNSSTQPEYKSLISKILVKEKQDRINFIVRNPSSIASYVALFQSIDNEALFFGKIDDLLYYKIVRDSLLYKYPTAYFVKLLSNKIASLEDSYKDHTSQWDKVPIRYLAFPDVKGISITGDTLSMHSLLGEYFLLDFWMPTRAESNLSNKDLLDTYSMYGSKGFKVFQIACNSEFNNTVSLSRELNIPWSIVLLSDRELMTTLNIYQIQTIPSNILFDKQGDIIGRNLYGKELARVLNLKL